MNPRTNHADATLHRAPDAAWRRVDDQVAIISLGANRVRVLNDVGSFVWERCDGATVDGLVTAVCGAFDVDEPTARRDVTAFVDDLLNRGMLVPHASAEPAP